MKGFQEDFPGQELLLRLVQFGAMQVLFILRLFGIDDPSQTEH